jgi:putative transposase
MANCRVDVWRANCNLYGANKLATAMRKAGYDVGRDQVARMMRILGIEGVRRGKHRTVTTRRDPAGTSGGSPTSPALRVGVGRALS